MDFGKDLFIFLQPQQKPVPPLFVTDPVLPGQAFRVLAKLLNAEKLGTERLLLGQLLAAVFKKTQTQYGPLLFSMVWVSLYY